LCSAPKKLVGLPPGLPAPAFQGGLAVGFVRFLTDLAGLPAYRRSLFSTLRTS
jgi:hypothetical protein